MDIQPANQQAISDDQELAKVLAGVSDEASVTVDTPIVPEPMVPPTPMPDPVDPMPQTDDVDVPQPTAPEPVADPIAMPVPAVTPADTGLDSIKQAALGELRPLVDKLDVSPEEKFDTYLLLLRSTDDKNLIAPAHEAARAIADEARRAQALLDIIKEIDFLSASQPGA